MNIIVWLLVGGLIGWVASIFMVTNNRQGMLLSASWALFSAAGSSADSSGRPR